MKKYILFFIAICSIITIGFAQDKDILFSINDKPVYVSEFERVYNKNLDLVQDDSQKDIDGYFNLFVDYKLKLEEAYAQELDEKPSYKRELQGYEKQLIQKYINDNEVTEQLVEEAYNRLQKEINANHILVKLDPNASPEQEAEALNKIKSLRERLVKEGFEALQKEVHDGKTVFAENLGYFTAFKMVYPFENAAYNTKVGEVSQPFKTRFGYHVVVVNDIRENRGELTVAHIMLPLKDQELSNQLYQRLQQGEDFKSLAKQYSVDKSSKNRGGQLKPFSGGQLSSPIFENQAFRLENIGEYSKPFKTKFGWHIVKLYAKKGMDTFEAEKRALETKVKRDSRSQILNDKRVEKLFVKYNLDYNNQKLKDFEAGLNDRFFQGLWNAPENLTSNKILVSIKDENITYSDFSKYLSSVQRRPQPKTTYKSLVKKYYKDFLDKKVTDYQEAHLVDENEEYANIYNEYKEGLLLFELMGNQIWNSSVNDSIALQDYFNENKSKYKFQKRIEATIASSANKTDAKNVLKLLKKNVAPKDIETQLNNDKIIVTFNSDTFSVNSSALPSKLKIKEGLSKIYNHNNAYTIVDIKTILDESQKSFEEAKGSVMSDFQEQKEQKWLKSLSDKYTVKVNKEAFERLKLKYN